MIANWLLRQDFVFSIVQRWPNMPMHYNDIIMGGVSNHQPHGCSLNRLFRRRSKKTSKLCVTGLFTGNSPVTGVFPTQRASNAENVSIWKCFHLMTSSWRRDCTKTGVTLLGNVSLECLGISRHGHNYKFRLIFFRLSLGFDGFDMFLLNRWRYSELPDQITVDRC